MTALFAVTPRKVAYFGGHLPQFHPALFIISTRSLGTQRWRQSVPSKCIRFWPGQMLDAVQRSWDGCGKRSVGGKAIVGASVGVEVIGMTSGAIANCRVRVETTGEGGAGRRTSRRTA
jgi:hypothetical protein